MFLMMSMVFLIYCKTNLV